MNYRQATLNDLEAVLNLSAEAFFQDPLYTIVKPYCKSEESYRKFVLISQQAFIQSCLQNSICFVGMEDAQIVAFSILERPNRKKLNFWQYIKHGGWKLLPLISLPKLIAYMNLLDQVMQPCEQLEACWYLPHLAINPAFQGSGLGTKMLTDCIFPITQQGQSSKLSLVTHKEINVTFYQRSGFKLFDHRKLTWNDAALDNWSLYLEG